MHLPFSVNTIRAMKSALSKWVLYLLASLAVGPSLAWLTGRLVDAQGGDAATLLISDSSPGVVALCFAACVLGSGALAWAGAKSLDAATGCLLAGICLAWAAWPLGTLESLARLHGEATPLLRLSIEHAICMGIALAVAFIVTKRTVTSVSESAPRSDFASRLPAILLGTAAAAAACTLVANTSMKGQTIAGAMAGGIAAAIVIQFLNAKKKLPISPVDPLISVSLVACLGPIAVLTLQGGKFESAVMAGKVLAFAKPLSLEWPGGGLLGTALGLSWASGAIDRHS